MPDQSFEVIHPDRLGERVRTFRQEGWRLVQIAANRIPEGLELTYSFDLDSRLSSLRLLLPSDALRIPSISSIYWAAFLYENELHDLFGLAVDGMVIDFKGTFYKTAVKFPFGTTKMPAARPAAAPPAPARPTTPAAPAVPAQTSLANN